MLSFLEFLKEEVPTNNLSSGNIAFPENTMLGKRKKKKIIKRKIPGVLNACI